MAIITDTVIGGITNGWRTFQSVRLSDCDCQIAWSVGTITDGITNGYGKSNAPVL
jgi:hypothetical protein